MATNLFFSHSYLTLIFLLLVFKTVRVGNMAMKTEQVQVPQNALVCIGVIVVSIAAFQNALFLYRKAIFFLK